MPLSFLFLLFSRVFPNYHSTYYSNLSWKKKIKLNKKQLKAYVTAFLLPKIFRRNFYSFSGISYLSTTHIIFLLVTFASLWPKRAHTHTQNLKGSFSPLWWRSWQRRTAHTTVGKQQGLLLFPFFSLGTHPHDGVTMIEGHCLLVLSGMVFTDTPRSVL